MTEDIRWLQRLAQFRKALAFLDEAMAITAPSRVERAGMIQSFEMAFELSWKLIKDYYALAGVTIDSPRAAFKKAFDSGLVTDGHTWMKLLQDRNLTTHVYNEETAVAVEKMIRETYHPLIKSLEHSFAERESN